MTTPCATTTPGNATGPARRRGPTVGGTRLGEDASREARRLAATILEVLAGARTPTEAATALALSLPRYYQLESQALRGLLSACEARPRGRQPSLSRELAAQRQETERWRREATRQQALVRAAQRAIGLTPPVPVRAGGKKPRRRRLARGLEAAARLRPDPGDNGTPLPVSPADAEST